MVGLEKLGMNRSILQTQKIPIGTSLTMTSKERPLLYALLFAKELWDRFEEHDDVAVTRAPSTTVIEIVMMMPMMTATSQLTG